MIELLPSREVFVTINGWSVHWYGLLYVVSFGVALWLLPKLQKYRGMAWRLGDWVEVMAWAAGGVIVGGRLGFVLLYEPVYFWRHPGAVFMLSQGGMSSHGGLMGVAVAVLVGVVLNVGRLEKVPEAKASLGKQTRETFLKVMDVAIVPAAIGLALGRVGNVINQELFATPLMQGLVVGKDLLIAATCYWYLRRKNSRLGEVVALFMMMYGTLRFLIEFGRVQDYPNVWGLTRGQWYTLPIVVVGVVWWLYLHNGRETKI